MSMTSAIIITALLALSVGVLIGWRAKSYDQARPTAEEIADYMEGVVEQEDYDARIRRNEAMLRDGGRRTMPRGNPGQPARITRMVIPRQERRR